jgi:hypothetical protein
MARSMYQVQLSAGSVTRDLEFYGRIVTHDNRKLFFPATAPVINQTVVVFEKSDSPWGRRWPPKRGANRR